MLIWLQNFNCAAHHVDSVQRDVYAKKLAILNIYILTSFLQKCEIQTVNRFIELFNFFCNPVILFCDKTLQGNSELTKFLLLNFDNIWLAITKKAI